MGSAKQKCYIEDILFRHFQCSSNIIYMIFYNIFYNIYDIFTTKICYSCPSPLKGYAVSVMGIDG